MLVPRMAHRIWKENKLLPGTAGPGNMLGTCLVSFHFLRAILSTSTVSSEANKQLVSVLCMQLLQTQTGSGPFGGHCRLVELKFL